MLLRELPPSVLVEILVRLPLETLLAARCACKSLLSLTSPNPQFTALHSSSAPPILIFQLGVSGRASRLLHWVEPELDATRRLKPMFLLPRFQRSNMIMYRSNCRYENQIVLTNSCNGLLYLVNRNPEDERSIVCNPVTNEYFVIRDIGKGIRVQSRGETLGMWLGFDPSIHRYKVLRVHCSIDDPSVVGAQVLLIGCDSWRDIQGTPPTSGLSWNACNAMLNGVIYWLDDAGVILFDFEKERFGDVALPQEHREERKPMTSKLSIGFLGGCLYLCYYDWYASRLDLWIMKRDVNQLGLWSKEFVVDIVRGLPHLSVYGQFQFIRPLQVLKNGDILLLMMGNDLVRLNPRTKSLRFSGFHQLNGRRAEALSLNPSLASLKDILKVDKVISHYERPRASWRPEEMDL